MAYGIIHEEMDFVPVLFGAQLKQVRQIVFVHGEDEVEGLEISPRHLSCPLSGNIDAVSPRHGDRSRIGFVARMPAAGAGGINGDPVGHAFTIGEVSQNPFGKRRAADIALQTKRTVICFMNDASIRSLRR